MPWRGYHTLHGQPIRFYRRVALELNHRCLNSIKTSGITVNEVAVRRWVYNPLAGIVLSDFQSLSLSDIDKGDYGH